MRVRRFVVTLRAIVPPGTVCAVALLTCCLAGGCNDAVNGTKIKARVTDAEHGRLRNQGPLFPFCEDGKWGYLNLRGQVVIEPRFNGAYDFADERAHVQTRQASGFIDEQGKLFLVPARLEEQLDWVGSFADGWAPFSVKLKCGYLDRRGTVVIEPQFCEAREFSEGLAAVNIGATWVHQFPHPHYEGGQWGFIDKAGRLVIPARFGSVEDFSDGLSLVSANSKMSYIDKKGKAVLQLDDMEDPQRWVTGAGRFSEGLAWVRTVDRSVLSGFIDKAGTFVIEPRFKEARDFSGGLAAVAVGEKWGYVDRAGRLVICAQFREARDFSRGRAAVRTGEGWCYIDQQGTLTIPGPYNDVENFSGGLARVHLGGSFEVANDGPANWVGGAWFYINRQGENVRRAWQDGDRPW